VDFAFTFNCLFVIEKKELCEESREKESSVFLSETSCVSENQELLTI
jgi:hypothetical protein